MSERIEITIWAEDGASRTFTAVADSASQMSADVEEAGGATDDVSLSIDDLIGALGALGVAFGVKEVAAFTTEMVKLGAETRRQTFALEQLAGSNAPEFMNKMSAATHGLLDDEDAAVVATNLLSTGLVQNADQAAEFTKNAVILGAAIKNMGAKESAEQFANMLNSMNTRQLKDFGLNIEVVKNRIAELKASNVDMSDQQAYAIAVMESMDARAGQLTGVLDDQQASLDKLAVAWQNLGEVVGTQTSDALVPAVEEITAFLNRNAEQGAAMADIQQQIAQTADTQEEYNQRMIEASVEGLIWQRNQGQLAAEWQKHQEEIRIATALTYENLEAQRANREQGLEPGTAALQEHAVAEEAARVEAEKFQQALDTQAGIQLKLQMSMDQLVGSLNTQSGVYQVAMQSVQGMGLSTQELLNAQTQLGLATGQLTLLEIEQANQMRQLGQLAAEGAITWPEYANALKEVGAGGDVAFLALQTLETSILKAGEAAGKSGDDLDKFVTSHLNAATKEGEGVEGALKKIEEQAIKVGKMETKVKMDYTQVDSANLAIAKIVEKDGTQIAQMDVVVNFIAAGDPAAIQAAQGGAG